MADLTEQMLNEIEAVAADQAVLSSAGILLEQLTEFKDPDSVGLNDCKTSLSLSQIKQGIQGFIHFATCRLGDLEDGQ